MIQARVSVLLNLERLRLNMSAASTICCAKIIRDFELWFLPLKRLCTR